MPRFAWVSETATQHDRLAWRVSGLRSHMNASALDRWLDKQEKQCYKVYRYQF